MTGIEHLEAVLGSFKHVGWVKGLTEQQYSALNSAQEFLNEIKKPQITTEGKKRMAKELRSEGHTIRQIAKFMGFKHPGSISHLLK